jgi:hypothetical protein
MPQKDFNETTPSHANDNGEQMRALLEQNPEVAPIDLAKYARRAADIISRAAVKARERLGRKSQR